MGEAPSTHISINIMVARTFPLCLGWLDHVEIDTLPLLHLILPCFASVVAFVCSGPGWTKGFTCATAQKFLKRIVEFCRHRRELVKPYYRKLFETFFMHCWVLKVLVLPCFFLVESYRSCIISGQVKLEGPSVRMRHQAQGCVVSLSLTGKFVHVVATTFP